MKHRTSSAAPKPNIVADAYTSQIVQDSLRLRAAQLHEAAETLPHGGDREALLHRAGRMETASSVIDKWMASPGIKSRR
jgi:hypothetical protein